MARQPLALQLGNLMIAGDDFSTAGYKISATADDASWGNPQPIEVTIQTLLQQGSSVEIDHFDNREAFIRVEVTAGDGLALAEGEAALFAELGKRNTLTWTPPQQFAPPTVFRVVTSSMDFEFDDFGELLGRRRYGIRLVCEPFARSVDEIMVDFETTPTVGGDPIASVDTLIDDCSSATGWTILHSTISTTTVSGVLWSTVAWDLNWMTRYGAVDMSATPLLSVKMRADTPGGVFTVSFDGGLPVSPLAGGTIAATEYAWYVFRAPPAGIVDHVAFRVEWSGGKKGKFGIAEVRRRNNPTSVGTLRQKSATAEVPGSAPSEGTLEVWHPTTALGTVLVHTTPGDTGQGFPPALRPYLAASGSTTLDSLLVSGAYEAISSSENIYRVPATLVPSGTYELGAWLQCSAAGSRTINWWGYTISSSAVTLPGSEVNGSTVVTFPAANTWYYFPLTRIQLPTLKVPDNSSAIVEVVIAAASGTVYLDDAYLFDIDRGALTLVDAGVNTRLWIKAASVEDPKPSILVGTLEDESDSYSASPSVGAWGKHETTPKSVNAFIVTRIALDASARLRLTPAHHTHATS